MLVTHINNFNVKTSKRESESFLILAETRRPQLTEGRLKSCLRAWANIWSQARISAVKCIYFLELTAAAFISLFFPNPWKLAEQLLHLTLVLSGGSFMFG